MHILPDISISYELRPVLRPSTKPSLFSIHPEPLSFHPANVSDSKRGAWLVLDLANAGTFTLPSPREASIYTDLNPRDRLIRQSVDNLAWSLTKRFTVRTSISAHLAVDVELDVMGPEEVLKAGGVEWKAELVETAPVVEEQRGEVRTGVPNHAVISSVVPRETATPGGEESEKVVFKQTDTAALPAEILASETIAMTNDEATAPRFPCSKLYLHLVVREAGVPIPPASGRRSGLFGLAEWIFAPLGSKEAQGQGQAEKATAPIHITLERLYLGAIPATALTMAGPMVVMLLLGWFGVRPWLESLLPTALDKGGKAE